MRFEFHATRALRAVVVAVAATALGQTMAEPVAAADKLDLNDISVLFPPPASSGDMDRLISMGSLRAGGQLAWAVYDDFKAAATGDAAKVPKSDGPKDNEERRIVLGAGGRAFVLSDWHIAGFRIDPGAPGLSDDIVREFGRAPQLRLIVQPVTRDGNTVKVHDVAAHLIYDFVSRKEPKQGCLLPRAIPDDARFKRVVTDLVALKRKLERGQLGARISTVKKPLDVHPGLAHKVVGPKLANDIKAFLEKHLADAKMSAMAVMGLPNGVEPWIFVAMAPSPPAGRFTAFPNPTLADGTLRAQMLSFLDSKTVAPEPANNNLNPTTCLFSFPAAPPKGNQLPVADRKGVATAELFDDVRFGEPVERTTDKGKRINLVVDTVADTHKSHFFNTDCVSCHTETHRAMTLLKPAPKFGSINPKVLPAFQWNVRNFGWFVSIPQAPGDASLRATITRRTKNETVEVLEWINRRILK